MDWTSRSKVLIGAFAGIIAASGIALALSSGGVSSTTAALADTGAANKGITTDGVGKVYGTPDTLNLSMGVNVTRGDVSSAFNAANAELGKVISALKAHHVDKKDIQTSGLSISPMYSSGTRPTITGYSVNNQITAVIHGLSKAGDTVNAAVRAGGNDVQVNSISVSLDDNPALLKAARENAFNDAKTKAEQYAQLSGRSLGKPLSIVESVQGPSVPQPFAYDKAAASGSAASLPVEAGQQAVAVTVTVVWDFS